MCDYTELQYGCDHSRYRVQRWCPLYEKTHKPCRPNVTKREYCFILIANLLTRPLADCRPSSPPPWEHMIRRSNSKRAPYV
ncbi:uncharacterized protein BCR38DRAFT_400228 [Pseudomassariella vexata]|uniref:Uncharacterized protein n=1 Tax=Pseudomassariella vexata TaxID=1141098 RepID=A0A1Y2DGW5_9PEZI|nr:uncharacterized protein BCR38DRAFT_400228 [Pseudomassariella vexata]ORY58492.1 hypothetical protein BCR38DRAFT_400228 [Pseudomassariella vexata]